MRAGNATSSQSKRNDRHFSATEHHSPCHVSARRTHVELMLDDRLLRGVVPTHVNQQHLIVNPTGQALHHSPLSRPRIVSRDVSLPVPIAPQTADPSCVSFEAFRPRMASRQAAALQSHVWFRSAGIESAPHWTRYGPGWRRRHKAEDQPAVGSHGTNH